LATVATEMRPLGRQAGGCRARVGAGANQYLSGFFGCQDGKFLMLLEDSAMACGPKHVRSSSGWPGSCGKGLVTEELSAPTH